jgi:hypothetical protein
MQKCWTWGARKRGSAAAAGLVMHLDVPSDCAAA